MHNCIYFGSKSEPINKWQVNGTITDINFVTRILINDLLFVLQFLEIDVVLDVVAPTMMEVTSKIHFVVYPSVINFNENLLSIFSQSKLYFYSNSSIFSYLDLDMNPWSCILSQNFMYSKYLM